MKLILGLAVAVALGFAVPANADTYLYEINAVYASDSSSSVTGSFTMDSSIGPGSISNVDINWTIGSFNFSFDQVVNPSLTWPIGYLWFANDAFSAGDTYFRMGFHYDTSLNDGSYLIGMWGNPANPHPSEISVLGVNDWQGITGRLTDAPVPWPRSIWVEVVFGFLGLSWMAYRRKQWRYADCSQVQTTGVKMGITQRW